VKSETRRWAKVIKEANPGGRAVAAAHPRKRNEQDLTDLLSIDVFYWRFDRQAPSQDLSE
jgi:hypothetical protein